MSDSSPPPGRGPGPSAILQRVVLVAAALPFLVPFLLRLGEILRSPWSRDYGEGCVLAMQQLLWEKGNYFTSYTDYPFVHGNYPPVFLALSLPSWWLLGPNLLAPRLVSVAATLALLLTIFALLRRLGAGKTTALAAVLLVPVPWFVQTWAPLARVDMLACLLSVLGLLVQEKVDERRGLLRYAALPLFWLAFFTKQSALLAPAAVFLHGLLIAPRRRRTLLDLFVFSAGLVLLLGLLLLASDGLAWRHLVPFTAAATYEWDRMMKLGGDFLVLAGPLLAVVVALCAVAPRRLQTGREGRYAIYVALNLLAIVTVAKAGAAQNYLIEPWVALVILSLLLLDRAAATRPDLRALVPAVALVALVVAGLADREKLQKRLAPTAGVDAAEFAELTVTLKAARGPVLSENLSAVVLAGKPVLVEPFGLGLISARGLAHPEQVVADCRALRFAVVVYEFRLRDIPGLDACLADHYQRLKLLGPYELLTPKH
jgi:hypothetical protein